MSLDFSCLLSVLMFAQKFMLVRKGSAVYVQSISLSVKGINRGLIPVVDVFTIRPFIVSNCVHTM